MFYFKTADGKVYANDSGKKLKQEDMAMGEEEVDALFAEEAKKEAELQEKRDRFKKVKECYLANPDDISRPERIEFSEYFTFADNDLFYPLEEYPLIVAQIEEWTLNGKLK